MCRSDNGGSNGAIKLYPVEEEDHKGNAENYLAEPKLEYNVYEIGDKEYQKIWKYIDEDDYFVKK